MKRVFLILAVVVLCSSPLRIHAEDIFPNTFITIKEAESTALENSHTVASQNFIVRSIRSRSSAEKTKMLPNLGFSASTMLNSEIGQITIPPLGTRDVGSRLNWSVGPTLDWVVWDTLQILNMARSIGKEADSAKETMQYDKLQVVLNARTSYMNVQLAKEQVRLVKAALALARSQYKDIKNKKDAGTADLLDITVAHEEVVDREKDLESATGELIVSKRAFVTAIGFDPDSSSWDKLDVLPIQSVLSEFIPKSNILIDLKAHPQTVAMEYKKKSSELAAKSAIAGYFPDIVVNGSATYEYPNFGTPETVQQNSATIGLQVPVFDWGKIYKDSKSFKYQAHSAGEQREQILLDLAKKESETRDRINTLKGLRALNVSAVRDAVEIAKLVYDSYQAGRVIMLDVQRANVKALSVQVDAARTDIDLGVQIANLLALSEKEGGAE